MPLETMLMLVHRHPAVVAFRTSNFARTDEVWLTSSSGSKVL